MADTRLRLVRRLIFFLIIVIGIALALAQFPAVKRVATGLLASTALLGLVVGFAARQTLANVIAGIVIAITQPIRVGDLVTFEDETGEVEDIRLAYTYIHLDNGQRLIVPNEALAQSSVHNHTVVDPRVNVEIDVWLPTGRRRHASPGAAGRRRGRRRPRERCQPRGHHAGGLQLGGERARTRRSGGAPA